MARCSTGGACVRCLGFAADGDQCTNDARYFVQDESFGDRWVRKYCGICDIEQNQGAGKLWREISAAETAARLLRKHRREASDTLRGLWDYSVNRVPDLRSIEECIRIVLAELDELRAK